MPVPCAIVSVAAPATAPGSGTGPATRKLLIIKAQVLIMLFERIAKMLGPLKAHPQWEPEPEPVAGAVTRVKSQIHI